MVEEIITELKENYCNGKITYDELINKIKQHQLSTLDGILVMRLIMGKEPKRFESDMKNSENHNDYINEIGDVLFSEDNKEEITKHFKENGGGKW